MNVEIIVFSLFLFPTKIIQIRLDKLGILDITSTISHLTDCLSEEEMAENVVLVLL